MRALKAPRWTAEEEDDLRVMYLAGATTPQLAQLLHRSEVTIRAKLSNCRGVWKLPTHAERKKQIAENSIRSRYLQKLLRSPR